MPTQISPMLAVTDGNAAIAFYQAAFGATLQWHLDGGHVVAGLVDRRRPVLSGARITASWHARARLSGLHDRED